MFYRRDCSSFDSTRQDLNSLSQVCSFVRTPVEREMYRDIHLNFGGWSILMTQDMCDSDEDASDPFDGIPIGDRKPASLPLLLNTLDQRPDLGGLIRCVILEWWGGNIYSTSRNVFTVMEQAVSRLLCHCSCLESFATLELPQARVFKVHHTHVTYLAVGFAPEHIPIIFEIFPALQTLHFLDFDPAALPSNIPSHNLIALRLDAFENGHVDGPTARFFAQALRLCGQSVEELMLRFDDFTPMEMRAPGIPRLLPNAGAGLVTVLLDNLLVLEHPSSGIASCLRDLPARYPQGGDLNHYSTSDFISALWDCLYFHAGCVRVVDRVVVVSTKSVRESSDYSLLLLLCNLKNISISFHDEDLEYLEIAIFCKLKLSTVADKYLQMFRTAVARTS
jgi:hypothetical protein